MTELLIAVAAVLLTSAMCSLLEAALYSVPLGHVEAMAQAGRRSGQILKRMRATVDRPIAAILSLNTIANTAGAAVAGAAASKVFGPGWLVYFSAGLTLAVLIFSEVVPKTAGVVYTRPLARFIAWPLQLMVWAMMPLVWICRFFTRLVSRNRLEPGISDAELVVMARMGMQRGTIQSHELGVIENILELERKMASDVMTPRSVMVALDQRITAEEARSTEGVMTHSRIPVYDQTNDDVVGIAYRRDILEALADGKTELTMAEMMRPVGFVPHSARLHQILKQLLGEKRHLLIVIDERGSVAGLVSLEDVMEEILGEEIVDEFDTTTDLRELARRRRDEIFKRN